MKYKIVLIVFIVIILSFYKNVYAETFYGEYRSVNDIGNYKEDEIFIDNYKLYNTYKIEYTDLGYMEDNDLYIKDENDYIEEFVYDFESDEYIEIITSKKNVFQFVFYGISKLTLINELEVYYKNIKDKYTIYNKHMLGSSIKNINDGDYDTVFKQIYDNEISLVLNKSYNIEDVTIVIYTEKCSDINMELFVGKNVPIYLTNNKKKKHVIKFKYDETIDMEEVNYNNKKVIKFYKYYKEDIVKLNEYIEEGDNILINDYKDITNIFVRDKIILKDELIIDNMNTTLYDLIEYSTDKVLVKCDINYKINGTYTCEFILNDINVKKDIVVDIEDNNIEREEIIKENKVMVEENIVVIDENEINVDEEKVLDVIEENKNIDENILNKGEQENNTIEKEYQKSNLKNIVYKVEEIKPSDKKPNIIKELSDVKLVEKNISKENVNNKSNKYIVNIVKYLIFINLVIIEIILYIKKRKRNNVERV